MAKRGRKGKHRSKDYIRGYTCAWSRAIRFFRDKTIPSLRRKRDKERNKDWREGLEAGLKSATHFYVKRKGK